MVGASVSGDLPGSLLVVCCRKQLAVPWELPPGSFVAVGEGEVPLCIAGPAQPLAGGALAGSTKKRLHLKWLLERVRHWWSKCARSPAGWKWFLHLVGRRGQLLPSGSSGLPIRC